ncbi:MAG TPA: hypothetical protein VFW39_02345 [Sphingomicrobium sp.]|nr:hypothetical protein [Sphingomicrobium sp.]
MTNDNDAIPAPKNPRAYAPRWVTYISAILDGLYDNTRSVAADSKTRMITLTCLKTLAKGNALSEAQKVAFIGNIRKRLGKDEFEWTAPIKLNRGQLDAARDLLARLEAKPSRPDAASSQVASNEVMHLEARIAALEALVLRLLETSGTEIPPFLRKSCTNPADFSDKRLDQNGFSVLTERNATERNHDVDMTCLSGGMTAVDVPTASNDAEPSTGDDRFKGGHESEIAPRQAADRIVVSYFRADPARAPSAKLELGDEKYNLIFHPADITDEKLRSACTASWLTLYEEAYGRVLRDQSRGNPRSDFRYVASPIYGAGDPFGYKKPVLDDCVAILAWGEAGQPESVIIFGDYPIVIPLRPNKQTKSNSPTHKGRLRLAA